MYTMYTRYIQQYRFSAGEKGSHFLTGRLASNCAYTRLRWLLRELLSFSVLCNIPVRDMAYPWWEYLYYSVGYCYSCVALRQCDVHVPARHKITNPLIPQQAAVILRPTGSHYVLPRSCAPLHGAGGASRKPLYILCTSK